MIDRVFIATEAESRILGTNCRSRKTLDRCCSEWNLRYLAVLRRRLWQAVITQQFRLVIYQKLLFRLRSSIYSWIHSPDTVRATIFAEGVCLRAVPVTKTSSWLGWSSVLRKNRRKTGKQRSLAFSVWDVNLVILRFGLCLFKAV